MDIVGIIEKHLSANRRLVVPELGAFVVKESGEVLFSELLKADDGVLRGLLSDAGMGELESDGAVDRFVFEVKYALDNGKRYQLGALGAFMRGADGALRFSGNTVNVAREAVLHPAQPSRPAAEAHDIPQPAPHVQPQTQYRQPETASRQATPAQRLNAALAEEKPLGAEQRPTAPAPKRPVSRPPRKKGVDWIMWLAVLILLAAMAVIGYGYWCSQLTGGDDAEMEALRWNMEQPATPLG